MRKLASTVTNIISKNHSIMTAPLPGDYMFEFVNQMKNFTNFFTSYVKFEKNCGSFYKILMICFSAVYWILLLLLAATISIFIFIENFRTSVHGKNIIYMLISILITYNVFPFSHHGWIQEFNANSCITVLVELSKCSNQK